MKGAGTSVGKAKPTHSRFCAEIKSKENYWLAECESMVVSK